jgi:beta-mannosidase
MEEFSLDGTWQLAGFPAGDPEARGQHMDELAIEATVPGNVELDLVRAGMLPEPFVGRNVLALAEYEHYEWWYRRTFETPEAIEGRTAFLRFDGLDCFATVRLNGEVLGHTANMLIPHLFEVTAKLRPIGESNELAVRIQPAVRIAAYRPYDPSVQALPSNFESLRVRKAAHMFGWDIAPRAVSAGIWRSVRLQFFDDVGVDTPYYFTRRADEGHAVLGVNWQLRFCRTEAIDWRGCQLRFIGVCGESRFEHTIPCRFSAGVAEIQIENPRLWWPKGYGEPALYEVTCQLLRDGKVLDERTDRIGIRTLELVRTDTTTRQQPGEFLFKVNRTPILVKGSNWVPADAFHSRDAERIPKILALFDDLGCNMIRCWGGNVYEDHPFFDFCDAHGILVWQDFAMACGRYPQDEEFLATMRTEAESVVRKLRNHPSLALWAGDNECDEAHLWWGRLDPNENRITREILPQVVRRCDPWRPYLPSSPYIAPAVFAAGDNSLMPEQHLWGPRDYYKSRFYTETTAHFVSEIGYHGCPAIDSLEEFLSTEALWPWKGNDEWRIHAADTWPEPGPYAYRIELMAKQIREVFGIEPDNLEDFVLASQICQAEAKKFFVEMVRLKKWRMTGLIWWNVMDCWPQFSDAIVDYYFRRKLAYLYLKRVQRPACIMMAEPENWACRVVLGNDSREAVQGRFAIRDADTDAILLEGAADAGPNENRPLGSVPASRGHQKLFLIEWELNGERGFNHYLLGTPPFDLERYRGWLTKLAAGDPDVLAANGLSA